MAGELNKAGFVSDKVLAVLDMGLLKRVTQDSIWDTYGQSRSIPANSNTKKGFALRYKNILPSTAQLAEYDGTVKPPVKIVREEVEYEVGHYGDYVRYTDELDLYDFRKIQSDFLDIMGDHAALSMETVRRDIVRGGTNVNYADGVADRAAVLAGDKKIDEATLDSVIIKLKAQLAKKFTGVIAGTTKVGTKPIRSAYIGVCSIYTTEDLRGLTGWKDVEDYADYSKRISDTEIGSYKDIRFVESNNDDGIAVKADGTVDADPLLNTSVIEQTMVMGKDAYCNTTVRGKKAIQTIIKPIGSAGTQDPLDQFGTIGWKAICGAGILNQAWLVRIEHTATNAVASNVGKHYFDYTV